MRFDGELPHDWFVLAGYTAQGVMASHARRVRVAWKLPALTVLATAVILIFAATEAIAPVFAEEAGFDLEQALLEAEPGDTISVPAGVYHGALRIDKPVILAGQDWPVIDGSGEGDVLTVNAPDVTIRGFVIRNSGDSLDQENAGITGLAPNLIVEDNIFEDVLFGIYLKEAPNSVIRNNRIQSKELPVPRRGDGIRLWYSADAVIEDNHVTDSRDVVIWFSPNAEVRRNVVENGRYGLHFMFSDNQLLEENVLRHNSVGAYLMYGRGLTMRNNLMFDNHGPSGYGVGLKDVDNILAEGNRMIGNRIGVYVDNSPRERDASVLFDHNLIAYNETGAILLPLVKRNTYTNNIFQENGEQIAIQGGGVLSDNFWSKGGQGNYWSDYTGFDVDADQIGDLPYVSRSLYEDLMETYPELRLFQLSPASDALDLAAEAFPIFEPRSKISDPHPLMVAPELPEVPGLSQPPIITNMLIAVFMLVLAMLVLWLGLGNVYRRS